MPNCLGIYTENNIIKYAKLDSDKNGTSFKLASYGVRFSENTQETIEEIIGETNSANDELATSITSEKYELIDINADVDFDSYKVVLNTCLGCGSWTFIFNTETTAKCNVQDIKFPKSIKYWSSTIINNNNVAYFLLSGEGDLYTFNATTKEINLILV